MPNATKYLNSRVLTETERVNRLWSQHQRAKSHDKKNWDRWQKNIRTYWGIDNDIGMGQWPASVVADLIQQGRLVTTFNLCKPSVNNFAGEILQSPFGFKYSPVDNAENSTTGKLNSQIYIDKDVADWRQVDLPLVTNGLIMRADIEMYIVDEYRPKQYIGLREKISGVLTWDPDWKTNISKDANWVDNEAYLSAEQILETYGSNAEMTGEIVKSTLFNTFGEKYVEMLAEWEFIHGADYGMNTGAVPYADRADIWGSRYKVVEHFEMRKIPRKVEYVVTEDGDEITIPENLSEVSQKIQWLNDNVPGWIPDQIFEETIYDKKQYVTTYCPGLSLNFILAEGPTEIQCNRLQFFPWSAYRMHGEYGGILDGVLDAQNIINWWESFLIHKLQVDGGTGSQFADPDAFETPEEFYDYVTNKNDPKKVFKLKRGWLQKHPQGPAIPTMKASFPTEAYEHLKHLIGELWPKLSGVTPASRGESESAAEPGVLYRMKKLQSQVERYVIHESLRNFWSEVGEAYMFQHVHMRSGKRIEFYDKKSKTQLVWNDRQMVSDDSGRQVEVMIDPVHMLKDQRHKVSVIESEDSPTRKDEIIQGAIEVVKVIDPAAQPVSRMDLNHEIIKNVNFFDDEQKLQYEQNHKKERALAEQQIATNTAAQRLLELQSQVQIKELEMRIKQIEQGGVPPVNPAMGGGMVNGTNGTNRANGTDVGGQPQGAQQGLESFAQSQSIENNQGVPQEQPINV